MNTDGRRMAADGRSKRKRESDEANLGPHRWKPGKSGNPAGRPKTPSIEALVNAVLAETVELPTNPEDPQSETVEVTKKEVVARIFVDLMRGRNVRIIREYFDRDWPKINLIGGSEDHPLTLADVVRKAGSDPLGDEQKRTPRKSPNGRKKAARKKAAKRRTRK